MEGLERAIHALILINLRGVDQTEQIRILASAGYKPAEIAEMLGVKANSAAKLLQRDRKGEGRNEKPDKAKRQ